MVREKELIFHLISLDERVCEGVCVFYHEMPLQPSSRVIFGPFYRRGEHDFWVPRLSYGTFASFFIERRQVGGLAAGKRPQLVTFDGWEGTEGRQFLAGG